MSKNFRTPVRPPTPGATRHHQRGTTREPTPEAHLPGGFGSKSLTEPPQSNGTARSESMARQWERSARLMDEGRQALAEFKLDLAVDLFTQAREAAPELRQKEAERYLAACAQFNQGAESNEKNHSARAANSFWKAYELFNQLGMGSLAAECERQSRAAGQQWLFGDLVDGDEAAVNHLWPDAKTGRP